MDERDRRILAEQWFHAIDFGNDVVTPGRFGADVPPNYTLYGFFDLVRHMDLSKARCFDIGCMDGIASFVMKALGAREVIACDMTHRETFELARHRLGMHVEYKTPINALELPVIVGNERADLILLAGVLYHVFDPLAVLVACREALRLEGLLVIETTFLFDESGARMAFNPNDDSRRALPLPHVYWRPSKRAVHGMATLAGFQVLSTVAVDGRLTVIAQAKRPSAIEQRAPRIASAQDRHRNPHYLRGADFDRLEADASEPAQVLYRGPRDDRFLYRGLYQPVVPFQPRWQPRSEAVRWRDVARSARIHATMRAAEARACSGATVRAALRRVASGIEPLRRHS
jgi:SAM-dependent methyltransferase